MKIEIMDQLKKGTTTVGLICRDGVVLASEKRATMGSFIASKAARKIYQVDDRMGLTTAGIVGDAQTLVRLISVEAIKEPIVARFSLANTTPSLHIKPTVVVPFFNWSIISIFISYIPPCVVVSFTCFTPL